MTIDPAIVDRMEKAAAGDCAARLDLASRYEFGLGVGRNIEKALFLYTLVAEKGVSEAQEVLGRFHLRGLHVRKNERQGLFWLRKAARGGSSSAAKLLGDHYREDEDRRPHPWRARVWYELAIALGDASVHCKLATLLFREPRTPEKTGLAMEHLRKGMAAGDLEAVGKLAYYANLGYGLPQDAADGCRALGEAHAWAKTIGGWSAGRRKDILMQLFTARAAGAFRPPEPPQVAEAEEEMARRKAQAQGQIRYVYTGGRPVHRLKPKKIHQLQIGASQGLASACEKLSHYYGRPVTEGGKGDLDRAIPLARLAAAVEPVDGLRTICTLLFIRGAPGDHEEAAYWLRGPAMWVPEAAAQLGFLFSGGKGVPRDTEAAIAFWHLGARANAGAAARAGETLVFGLHAPVDEEIGIEMLRSAFRTGHPAAANILGTCYDEGAGVPQDGRRAKRFFTVAARKGLSMAALNLGILLFDGRRVEPNPVEAVKWLEQAAADSWGPALHLLAVMVYRGEGTARNVERAQDLFRRAQEAEHLPSLFTTIEDEVLRVRPAAVRQRDFAGMIRRAEDAARGGKADAAFLAALAHWNGEADIPLDEDKAREFFRIAAEAGHVLAQACLSEALRKNREIDEADEWLTQAAEGGLREAENRLRSLRRVPQDLPQSQQQET